MRSLSHKILFSLFAVLLSLGLAGSARASAPQLQVLLEPSGENETADLDYQISNLSGGQVVPVTLKFSNLGTETLTLNLKAGTESCSSPWSCTLPPASIAGGSSATVTSTLTTPYASGTWTASYTLATNDPNNPNWPFQAQGTNSNVYPNMSVIVGANPGITITPPANPAVYSFTAPTPPGTPTSVQVSIENADAGEPLSITNYSLTGSAFTLLDGPFPTSIGIGDSSSVRFRLESSAPGNYSGVVSFNTDEEQYATYSLTLSGTVGMQIVSGDGQLQSSGGTYVFPSTGVGTPVSVLFTLTNADSTALTISNPTTLVDSADGAFSEIVDLPSSIPAAPTGNTGSFRVRFDPSTTGTHTATVTILSNAPSQSSYSFTVTGTAD